MERKNVNNLNTLNHIPVNKVKRATSLVSAGVKLSGNYLRYYGEKVLKVEGSRGRLDKKNARDIYDSLKTLKGSALKVAQMLSMENNLLPSAYVEQFSLSQFSVPPLSSPLVNKLVKKYLGKSAHQYCQQPHGGKVSSGEESKRRLPKTLGWISGRRRCYESSRICGGSCRRRGSLQTQCP